MDGVTSREEVRTVRRSMSMRSVAPAPFRGSGSASCAVRMRLNWRGRLMVALLAAAGLWAVWGVVAPQSAQSSPGATSVVSYVVQPGDTMWSYAADITPAGQDVSRTVDRLVEMNDLDSVALYPGQRLIVPAQ